jgi:D-glycero-D-manno-heptose 1,7-bisphosphate phosphatase
VAVNRRPGQRALFLDKDGTLVENVPYGVDPAEIRLTRGAGPALRRLSAAGFAPIVVSNQSGVARGLFPPAALEAVERRLAELLQPFGVKLAGFFCCPHHPAGTVARFAVDCLCRKPKPGMLTRAAECLGVDLASSWMVGDILDDVEAGCRAGCRTLLLDRGGETEWHPGPCRTPDARAGDLARAADLILGGPDSRKEEGCDAILSN